MVSQRSHLSEADAEVGLDIMIPYFRKKQKGRLKPRPYTMLVRNWALKK